MVSSSYRISNKTVILNKYTCKTPDGDRRTGWWYTDIVYFASCPNLRLARPINLCGRHRYVYMYIYTHIYSLRLLTLTALSAEIGNFMSFLACGFVVGIDRYPFVRVSILWYTLPSVSPLVHLSQVVLFCPLVFRSLHFFFHKVFAREFLHLTLPSLVFFFVLVYSCFAIS